MKFFIAMAFLFFSTFSSAHPLDMRYLEIDFNSSNGKLILNFDYNPIALKSSLSLDNLFALNNCRWLKINSSNISVNKSRITGECECTLNHESLSLKMLLIKSFSRNYQVVGRINIDKNESTFLLNQKIVEQNFALEQQKSFSNFIMMGIEHIGVTPEQWHNHIPDGIDHILFVVALMLLGGGLRNTIKIVSGFTLGHSLSLVLATFNVISIPPSIIEPAIAISIVYVGIEALILKKSSHRWIVSCCFGMVHGFGFATALEGLVLTTGKMIVALVGFNLGVEAGQIVIALIVLPLLFLLSLRSSLYKVTIRYASICIVAVASYWFLQRTVF